MNMMTQNGYKAKIEYDPDIDMFRGEILGLNGGADFYGETPAELKAEFKKSLETFLEVCKEKGISPKKQYSGRFNLRIPPKLHSDIVAKAATENKSINQWVAEKLEQSVHASSA